MKKADLAWLKDTVDGECTPAVKEELALCIAELKQLREPRDVCVVTCPENGWDSVFDVFTTEELARKTYIEEYLDDCDLEGCTKEEMEDEVLQGLVFTNTLLKD